MNKELVDHEREPTTVDRKDSSVVEAPEIIWYVAPSYACTRSGCTSRHDGKYVRDDSFAALIAERDALREALKEVLATGLNGAGNVRLAYLAAGQKALSPELLAKADLSQQAVENARTALASPEHKTEG